MIKESLSTASVFSNFKSALVIPSYHVTSTKDLFHFFYSYPRSCIIQFLVNTMQTSNLYTKPESVFHSHLALTPESPGHLHLYSCGLVDWKLCFGPGIIALRESIEVEKYGSFSSPDNMSTRVYWTSVLYLVYIQFTLKLLWRYQTAFLTNHLKLEPWKNCDIPTSVKSSFLLACQARR